MLNPCKEREPRVIDNELITTCIERQFPKGEVGRLLHNEGMPLEEVKEIRFEHLYILRIDHLWVLKSLVKLSLNNNFIEKIENLETLVHLKELDLSFNKIKTIKNLDNLVNLQKLTLYENLIESIENMDQLTQLTVFSIGKNKLVDQSCVNYFRKFQNLISLNMAGNPCAEEENFRYYVAAFLPTLVYYEYKRITDKERTNGVNIFAYPLRQLEKIEYAINEKQAILKKELEDGERNSKMFVEFLNTNRLFEAMYENDQEGKLLLEIGDDVEELNEEYQKEFNACCYQIFEIGKKHYAIRQAEMDNFMNSIEKTKKLSQQESIEYMETFVGQKDEIFTQISTFKVQLEHDVIFEDYYLEKVEELRKVLDDLIHYTWKNLMRLEVTLFEQADEVNQTFSQVMGEMVNNFIEEAQGTFGLIRAAEVTYSENMSDAAIRYMTTLTVNPELKMPGILQDILQDKDTLANAIAATHDLHMQAIDAREDLLTKRAKGWLDNLSDELTTNEIKRNRYKVLEINHFLDKQKYDFEELIVVILHPAKTDGLDE